MTLIHHLAEPAHWAEAVRTGSYRISTRGRTLEQEGFIHAAGDDQWRRCAGASTPTCRPTSCC